MGLFPRKPHGARKVDSPKKCLDGTLTYHRNIGFSFVMRLLTCFFICFLPLSHSLYLFLQVEWLVWLIDLDQTRTSEEITEFIQKKESLMGIVGVLGLKACKSVVRFFYMMIIMISGSASF